MLHIDGWMDGVITITLGPIQFAKSSKRTWEQNLGKLDLASLNCFGCRWKQNQNLMLNSS